MCRTDFDVISFRGFRPTAKLGLAQIESSECSRRQVSTTFDRCLPVSRFAETLRPIGTISIGTVSICGMAGRPLATSRYSHSDVVDCAYDKDVRCSGGFQAPITCFIGGWKPPLR